MESGRSGSYYAVLGVRPDASSSEIRRAYRKLAMKWHPDRCGRQPWAVDEAKRRFQQIHEAYQVLSDEGKRTLYDAGLYDPFEEDEEVEGFSDFVQEMVNLMSKVRKEEKECSLKELQRMLGEMAQGFVAAPPFSSQCLDSGGSYPIEMRRGFGVKRIQWLGDSHMYMCLVSKCSEAQPVIVEGHWFCSFSTITGTRMFCLKVPEKNLGPAA